MYLFSIKNKGYIYHLFIALGSQSCKYSPLGPATTPAPPPFFYFTHTLKQTLTMTTTVHGRVVS